jgi:SnoaL-like domain
VTGQDDTLSPQEVSDRLRIHDLLVTYAAAVDDRDWDALRSVFSKDAVLDYSMVGGPRTSLDEAIPWLEKSLAAVPMTQHIITNVLVDLDGDTAEVRALLFNPLGPRQGPMLLGGSYRDRAERTADGWRITELVAELTWSDRPVRPPKTE